MKEEIIQINIPSDIDNHITFQCPFCNERFKLNTIEYRKSHLEEIFCSYCGLIGFKNKFLNDEVIDLAMDKA